MASNADRYSAYNPQAPTEEGPGPIGYLALVLAWVVPGLGHMLIGQKARGAIFMITIHLLFAAGMFIGGIRVINPPDQAIWTYTQFLTGWPMFLANHVEKASRTELGDHSFPADPPGSYNPSNPYNGTLLNEYMREGEQFPDESLEHKQDRTKAFIARHPVFAVSPKIQDLGAVYCGIAGMLNLLVMFDVLLRITGSTREDPAAARSRANPPANQPGAQPAASAEGAPQ